MTDNSASKKDFQIVSIAEVPLNEVMGVLNQSLGPGHDEAWFRWKHIDNPYGRSLGWVARSEDGVIGVRLFMRWRLHWGGERIVEAVRPVDAATMPMARRKGVFSALTQHALQSVYTDPQIGLIFSTPNENSRSAYSRMGWSLLPPIAHGVRPVLPGKTGDIDTSDAVFSAFDKYVPQDGQLSSYRSAEVAKWRYSDNYRMPYEKACLRQSEAANGVIYRTIRRQGIRFLAINELIGLPLERALLVRSVARRERALAVMAATGLGALDLFKGSIRRGHSILAARPAQDLEFDICDLRTWALTLGDLEGAI